jgi:uncharacterized membrane protein YoaK (UPF0700 family)
LSRDWFGADTAGELVPGSNLPDQSPHSPHRFLDILLLTLVAGSADALGYLNLGKVFTSNMTGNVVLMGISVSEGRGADTGRSHLALLAFVVGNCAGAWLCHRFARKDSSTSAVTIVIALEALLLVTFALTPTLLPPDSELRFAYTLIALLAASMGLQAAAVYRLGTTGVTTTAITGTITTLLNGLMKTLSFLPPASSEKPTNAPSFALLALVILTYCGGAALSGFLNLHVKPYAGFLPAAVVLLVVTARLTRPN